MEDAMSAWLCVAEDEGFDTPTVTPQQRIIYTQNDTLSIYQSWYEKNIELWHILGLCEKCIASCVACRGCQS